ncbi:MAG: hypothetical protein U0166_14075 [Acidobacteriota bacterium]
MKKPILVALTLLLASPLRAWDEDTHRQIVRLALAASPEALRAKLKPVARMLEDSATNPDTAMLKKSMHGEAALKQVVETIDQLRAATAEPTPTQLAAKLGLLSHLVADYYALEEDQARLGRGKWLDNNMVLLDYDGPSSAADGKAVVAEWSHLRGMLNPLQDLGSMRLDLAFNAVLDAWQLATSGKGAWEPSGLRLLVGRGTAWAEGGLGLTKEEQANLAREQGSSGSTGTTGSGGDAEEPRTFTRTYKMPDGTTTTKTIVRAPRVPDTDNPQATGYGSAPNQITDAERMEKTAKGTARSLRVLEQSATLAGDRFVVLVRVINETGGRVTSIRVSTSKGKTTLPGPIEENQVRRFELTCDAGPGDKIAYDPVVEPSKK